MYQALCLDMAGGKPDKNLYPHGADILAVETDNKQDQLVDHVCCIRVVTGALEQNKAGQGNPEC